MRIMNTRTALFSVGRIVHHRRFAYRGVIVDVDPVFDGTEDWYEQMARSRPPKDKPWYHVLVHGSDVRTYVAERNLEPDTEGGPIVHPHVDVIFEGLADGEYIPRSKAN